MNQREKGLWGEQFAADWLQNHGYEILARNWRKGHGEIDIIARKEDIIAFVEVKLRSKNSWEKPAGSVHRGQMRRIVETAVLFLQELGLYNNGIIQPRFDVFEITTEAKSLEVVDFYHIEHAYDLEGLGVFL